VRELEIGDYKGEESVTAILKQQQLLRLVRLFAITVGNVRYNALSHFFERGKRGRFGQVSDHIRWIELGRVQPLSVVVWANLWHQKIRSVIRSV
jgi:hypothetical protein